MTDDAGSAAPTDTSTCYRHPDRESYVLCQRCGRTICPQCQTQAAVGVHCPECVREARQSQPRRAPAIVRAFRPGGDRPVVTLTLIAVCVLVYVVQYATGGTLGRFTQSIAYFPLFTASEPWTMVTSMFAHGSIIHLLLNMYSLYIFGPILEHALGRGRFIALYLLAGLGGSVAVLLIGPEGVLGASGAIFGLMGAFFVIERRFGGNSSGILVLVAINLAIGFIPGLNVSWQAHVGGLVVGSLVAWIYLRTRLRRQRTEQWLLVSGVGAALVAVTALAVGGLLG